MNWLAHAALSGKDPLVLVGNVLGDFIRGPLPALDLHPEIVRGVGLHRRMDSCADAHPAVAKLRAQFPPRSRRLAGVLIDLGFDHVLSQEWNRYMPQESWVRFHRRARHSVALARRILPPDCSGPVRGIVLWKVLESWVEYSGVERSVLRACQRLGRPEWVQGACEDLRMLLPRLSQALPDLWSSLDEVTSGHRRA